MWGFGATLGADVANAAFGEAKVGGYMYLTFGFVVWGAFLLSLDDIVGVVAALSVDCGCWTLTTTGVWDEVWRGMICVLKEVWIQ